ncbi:helix-turn-helix domain-containing protein [Parvibaculum sp.]|uniref:helix-turn-helix domain-containing protein n=1 Tax=Parvibaculum sp. TaxID=2024848 RepID=UPI002CE5BF2E|nr:helix-turn-helix domain-containing protein [Parvibaculum sp.]HUD52599.1 helix-turn-helix domain-containing protein [Parvibaculum sp.]
MQVVVKSQFAGFGETRRAVFLGFEGRPAHRTSIARPAAEEIECAARIALTQEIIARALDVPVGELRATTRRRAQVALARQIAMYLAHVAFGLSLSTVGQHFGRDRTTAAHACRQMEDRRDDRDFDVMLDRLEGALRAFPIMDVMQ